MAERDYNSDIVMANIDATLIAAQGIPVTGLLEVMQTEFDTGKAEPATDPSLYMQAWEFLTNQDVVDWKAVTLVGGMFMLTSVQRGLEAKKNAEYQRFMIQSGMELGSDSFMNRTKQRLKRGAALAGAYAVGTRLNLGADFAGAASLTAGAVGYGVIQSRKMGWRLFGRR